MHDARVVGARERATGLSDDDDDLARGEAAALPHELLDVHAV